MMKNDIAINRLLDKIEGDLETCTMLNTFQLGIALRVIEDRMWDVDDKVAQRCNDLQRKALGEE